MTATRKNSVLFLASLALVLLSSPADAFISSAPARAVGESCATRQPAQDGDRLLTTPGQPLRSGVQMDKIAQRLSFPCPTVQLLYSTPYTLVFVAHQIYHEHAHCTAVTAIMCGRWMEYNQHREVSSPCLSRVVQYNTVVRLLELALGH